MASGMVPNRDAVSGFKPVVQQLAATVGYLEKLQADANIVPVPMQLAAVTYLYE